MPYRVLLVAFLLCRSAIPQDDKRPAVPDAAALKDAEKTIRDLFKDEYARRAPADRLALAKKLFEQGLQTRDDAGAKYVLLREAQDLAAQAGNIDLAVQIIGEWSKAFQVDGPALNNQALAAAGQNAKTPEECKALASLSLKLVADALAAEDYEGATKLVGTAAAVAKRSKDIPLISRINARTKEVADLKSKSDAVRKARETLAASPEDAAAKSAVGWHLCATKGDWDGGLALLASGADEALKTAATKDLSKPAEAPERVSLGDLWWDLGEKRPADKEACRRRAVFWYELAITGMSGLNKLKLGKRLNEAKAEQMAREGWLDVTDPGLFGLPGRPGDPLSGTADRGFTKIELKKMPTGEVDAFSVRLTFGPGNDGQVKIMLENRARELFVQNGSIWCNFQGTNFMHKGTKQDEYAVTGTLLPGEWVFTLDGKEVGRSKTTQTRLTTFGFDLNNGQFKIDQIRLRRKE